MTINKELSSENQDGNEDKISVLSWASSFGEMRTEDRIDANNNDGIKKDDDLKSDDI